MDKLKLREFTGWDLNIHSLSKTRNEFYKTALIHKNEFKTKAAIKAFIGVMHTTNTPCG
ncbi:hypothetical protein SNK12g_02460 [Lactiplantibacillus plantarum]|nr:hypothetical protein SN35N_1593 [Lactiplantibacillus plantarum]